MAKKMRKKAAAKVAKKSKASTKKKRAVTKRRRHAAARKKLKPVVRKNPVRKTIRKAPPESFLHKVEDVFTAVVDTLKAAERLHHKMDPGVSREPE